MSSVVRHYLLPVYTCKNPRCSEAYLVGLVNRKRGELVMMLWGPGFRSTSKQLNFAWAQEDLHASMQHSTISFRLVRRTP